MDLIVSVLGPKRQDIFIAENYIFVKWNNDNSNKITRSDLLPDEEDWIEASGFLNESWCRENEIDFQKYNCLFLPLHAGLLVGNFNLIHEKCILVDTKDIPGILSARFEILKKFNIAMNHYSNFNLYLKWPLFKFIQDQLVL